MGRNGSGGDAGAGGDVEQVFVTLQFEDARQVRSGIVKKFHARGAVTFSHGVEGFFELGFALCVVHGWLSITSLLRGSGHLVFNGTAKRQVGLIFYWLKPLLKLGKGHP